MEKNEGPDNPTCQLLSRSTKHVSKAGKIKEMVEDRLCERAGCDRVVCERVVWKKVVCERFVCMTGMRVCVCERVMCDRVVCERVYGTKCYVCHEDDHGVTGDQARHRSQSSATSATPATQKHRQCHQVPQCCVCVTERAGRDGR